MRKIKETQKNIETQWINSTFEEQKHDSLSTPGFCSPMSIHWLCVTSQGVVPAIHNLQLAKSRLFHRGLSLKPNWSHKLLQQLAESSVLEVGDLKPCDAESLPTMSNVAMSVKGNLFEAQSNGFFQKGCLWVLSFFNQNIQACNAWPAFFKMSLRGNSDEM